MKKLIDVELYSISRRNVGQLHFSLLATWLMDNEQFRNLQEKEKGSQSASVGRIAAGCTTMGNCSRPAR